jgi:hypothetical protein
MGIIYLYFGFARASFILYDFSPHKLEHFIKNKNRSKNTKHQKSPQAQEVDRHGNWDHCVMP